MPAAAVLSGDYTLHLYEGPTHERAGSWCFTFPNTGNIEGFPDSGTWTAPDNAAGNFVVDGNQLRWYGLWSTGGGDIALNGHNTIKNDVPGKGGYDMWFPNEPPTPDSDGTTKMTAACN